MLELLWGFAIFSSALAGGVALSHVLEVPGKRRLNDATVLVIQQCLYPGFRIFGMLVEPAALIATLVLTIALVGDGLAFVLALAASAALFLMGLVFPLVTQPANKAIATWRSDDRPVQWRNTLRRWELSHALRSLLMVTAAILLTVAAMLDGPM